MARIQSFSTEVLVNIFSHYIESEGHEAFSRNIPLVCRKWNEISSSAPLWKNFKTRDVKYLLNVAKRQLLYYTHSLEFHFYNETISVSNLSAVLENIIDLKVLVLKNNTMSCDVLSLLTEHCPHLENLYLEIIEPRTLHELNQFLTVCGPTLKHLHLGYCRYLEEAGPQPVSLIADKCNLLETLSLANINQLFSIQELPSRCPGLSELSLYVCRPTAGENDSSGCEFKKLKKFIAGRCDFSDLDVYKVLKDSVDLEHLELYNNENFVFENILKIPSDKVKMLEISLKDPNTNLKFIADSVHKWRLTLSALKLGVCDTRYVLEHLLLDNPNPQLEWLAFRDTIDPRFFEWFIQNCQNLVNLWIDCKMFKGREEFKEAVEVLVKRHKKNWWN